MKTKLVRPIFIDVNDIKISIVMKGVMPNLCRLTTDVIDDEEWLRFGKPQQLILISLDPNEKIEENDSWIGYKIGEIEEESKLIIVTPENRQSIFHNIVKSKFGKVIATQDQLSHELIQQLVAEYNNGGMRDFEIEMGFVNIHDNLKYKCGKTICYNTALNKTSFYLKDKKYIECKVITRNLNGWGHIQFTNYSPNDILNGGRGIYLLDLYYQKPKLTNGFVTVVDTVIGKPLEDYIYEKHNQDRCIGFIDGYKARKLEEPINYNEEEVWKLLQDMHLEFVDSKSKISLKQWFDKTKTV